MQVSPSLDIQKEMIRGANGSIERISFLEQSFKLIK